ncbi:hypothetical protein [Nocardia terpenica]|uniref:Uncharacterized protein n=1 Tax=Nocardia terpenica TaxID=455432 RepID=A0A6G9ZDH2_9NOCA|nr:hypothetical protein [Nocardia terpenica]QIS23669.1 hypothetical protein F6W96_40755 [Nocardia terpenica]
MSPNHRAATPAITLVLDETRLADCLLTAAAEITVPLTGEEWKTRWHKTIRDIIDRLVDHGRILTAPGLGRSVTLRYDFLRKPRGVVVFATVNDDGDFWDGPAIATARYSSGHPFAAEHTSATAAATAAVRTLVADLNHHLTDLQTILGLACRTRTPATARPTAIPNRTRRVPPSPRAARTHTGSNQ